jgi:hypothetical protein
MLIGRRIIEGQAWVRCQEGVHSGQVGGRFRTAKGTMSQFGAHDGTDADFSSGSDDLEAVRHLKR